MTKSKFDKKKCLKCRYHGMGSGAILIKAPNGKIAQVFCNYSGITGKTCLRAAAGRKSIDLRGDDYENCKLYERGM